MASEKSDVTMFDKAPSVEELERALGLDRAKKNPDELAQGQARAAQRLAAIEPLVPSLQTGGVQTGKTPESNLTPFLNIPTNNTPSTPGTLEEKIKGDNAPRVRPASFNIINGGNQTTQTIGGIEQRPVRR